MKRILTLILIVLDLTLQAQSIPTRSNDISPLLVGERAPAATIRNVAGGTDSLNAILSRKPTVLLFYRGGWCPYCNTQLAELQSLEKEILRLGYQIVAVSPDSPENLAGTGAKHTLNYSLYSDADLSLAQAFGIAFQAPENYNERLLKSSAGLNSGLLPVPAVFILNMQGEILFEYINPDYKKRIKGNLLMAVLKALQ